MYSLRFDRLWWEIADDMGLNYSGRSTDGFLQNTYFEAGVLARIMYQSDSLVHCRTGDLAFN